MARKKDENSEEQALDKWIITCSRERAEQVIRSLLTPKENLAIGPAAKDLLQAIRDASRKIGPLSSKMASSAPEADDHWRFEASESDLVTIRKALQRESPQYFHELLAGGEAFLAHVVRCGCCLASLNHNGEETTAADPDAAYAEDRAMGFLRNELAKCGVEPIAGVDAEACETVHDEFRKIKGFKPN